jgi:riboflavin kinase/FMN adenylyltransferase
MINGEVVSSTAIRNALAEGDMKRVHNMAGRLFSLSGGVVHGAKRGEELGFPTANLDVDEEQALPLDGVYATMAYFGDQAYQSVTSIGRRPTFDAGQRTVEVYILDYRGDLYGHKLRIDIIERLRDEKQFNAAEELKKQIAEDVKRGKAILNSQGKE